MANQRAKDQQLLPFYAKRQFVSEVDAALQQINVSNRSQFIRDAILEKLEREGIRIPRNLASAPARTQSDTADRSVNSARVQDASRRATGSVRKNHKSAGE